MSPLNRGPLMGPRLPPAGIRPPPPPRFGARLPLPGMPPRMPPPPMSAVFGPMRQRLPPPPRPGGVARPGGPLPLFPPGGRGMTPLPPMAGLRGTGPRGPLMRPWPRRVLPPQILPHMRPRFSGGNGAVKGKVLNNAKKVIKLEELELKKPWMTDEIRSEIQKKNKLYAKAKKNKDAKEWEEFKDLRNKVTRMIRDAKNEYFAKHPEQAHLYPNDEEPYDQRDENYESSDDDKQYYCEVCDREFPSEDTLSQHISTHKLCGIDGCIFSAHPLLVEKHIRMQHSTGLYQRMKNLQTPEGIQKWIEERKRKYPTKANIEAQKAAEQEKKQRGEIIEREQGPVRPMINKMSNHREKKRKVRKRQSKQTLNTSVVKEVYRGLVSFPGTSCLENENSNENSNKEKSEIKCTTINELTEDTFNISDEEDVENKNNSIKNTQAFSLVADYGSDSENDECPEEVPIKKVKTVTDQNEVTEKVFTSDQSSDNAYLKTKNEDQCNISSDTSQNKTVCNTSNKVDNVARRIETRPENSHINRKRNNQNRLHLLQRLLSKSIQHERNVICQCIKYIVDNNFLD